MIKVFVAANMLWLYVLSVEAQLGTVRFSNLVPGFVDQPVFLVAPGSNLGPGNAGGFVQLILNSSPSSATSLTAPIPYLGTTSPLSKYFDGGSVQIPGTSPGGSATLQVYSWEGTPSFDTALARGVSAPFVVRNLGSDGDTLLLASNTLPMITWFWGIERQQAVDNFQ
jgi:hypothetical protein